MRIKKSSKLVKAIWNGVVIAESDATIIVEGNHYFPPESVDLAYLRPIDHHTMCFWKGTASYYDVEIDGQTNQRAAWYYPASNDAASQIKGYIAFWKGIRVTS